MTRLYLILTLLLTGFIPSFSQAKLWESTASVQDLFTFWDLDLAVTFHGRVLVIQDTSPTEDSLNSNVATVLYLIKDELDYKRLTYNNLELDSILYYWQTIVITLSSEDILSYIELTSTKATLQFTEDLLAEYLE